MGNIRQMLDFTEPYWRINREERNYAALLYYALLGGDSLPRFLNFVGCEFPFRKEELAAYVEYAYLRDLWDASHASNSTKRMIITELLDTADVRALKDASILEWNEHFGVGTPVASSSVIQSPSRWSMQKFHGSIVSDHDFLATCTFKWSFNIKPDLVIHTDNDHAVVIEAKYTAGEGSYPASSPEKLLFKDRGLSPVGQTELQEYMFRHLLGVDALYLYVVSNPKAQSATHKTLLWRDIFDALDLSEVPAFVMEWLRALAAEE